MSTMVHSTIEFDHKNVEVEMFGCDQKSIPSLLNALKRNKLTLYSIQEIAHIELFNAEAFLYNSEGNRYRIPIF